MQNPSLKKKDLRVLYGNEHFNEFIVKLNKPVNEVNERLLEKGIIGGYDLSRDYSELANHMLVAVTEMRTKEEIDLFVKELGDCHE